MTADVQRPSHRRTDHRGGVVVTEDHRPRSRRRRWFGRLVLLALFGAVVLGGYIGARGLLDNFGGPRCQAIAVAGGPEFTLSPEQMANAATIAAVAQSRGLPPRAASIAITTAIQESKLRNLGYGDRDSLGLFQQRPSQGWGTAAQIQDPVYASNRFYDELVKIDGYQTASITKIAQQIQRSGYPGAYAEHETEGRTLASVLTGRSPGGLGCRLKPVQDGTASSPQALATTLEHQLGEQATVSGRTVTVRAGSTEDAWATGAWAVAHAQFEGVTQVTVGTRSWTRSMDESASGWQEADSAAGTPTTVAITLP